MANVGTVESGCVITATVESAHSDDDDGEDSDYGSDSGAGMVTGFGSGGW